MVARVAMSAIIAPWDEHPKQIAEAAGNSIPAFVAAQRPGHRKCENPSFHFPYFTVQQEEQHFAERLVEQGLQIAYVTNNRLLIGEFGPIWNCDQ
jgi:hypothetical protein